MLFLLIINTSKVLKRWFFFVQNEEKKQLIEICDQSSMLKKNGSVTKKALARIMRKREASKSKMLSLNKQFRKKSVA